MINKSVSVSKRVEYFESEKCRVEETSVLSSIPVHLSGKYYVNGFLIIRENTHVCIVSVGRKNI